MGQRTRNPLKAAYAKNCVLARRFFRQGVRYVSLYCASRASAVDGLLNWDAHKTLKAIMSGTVLFDQPTAALLSTEATRTIGRHISLVVYGIRPHANASERHCRPRS